jgi:hypothetical protein
LPAGGLQQLIRRYDNSPVGLHADAKPIDRLIRSKCH